MLRLHRLRILVLLLLGLYLASGPAPASALTVTDWAVLEVSAIPNPVKPGDETIVTAKVSKLSNNVSPRTNLFVDFTSSSNTVTAKSITGGKSRRVTNGSVSETFRTQANSPEQVTITVSLTTDLEFSNLERINKSMTLFLRGPAAKINFNAPTSMREGDTANVSISVEDSRGARLPDIKVTFAAKGLKFDSSKGSSNKTDTTNVDGQIRLTVFGAAAGPGQITASVAGTTANGTASITVQAVPAPVTPTPTGGGAGGDKTSGGDDSGGGFPWWVIGLVAAVVVIPAGVALVAHTIGSSPEAPLEPLPPAVAPHLDLEPGPVRTGLEQDAPNLTLTFAFGPPEEIVWEDLP